MAIEFGLSLPAGPPKGQISKWLDDTDRVLPKLAGKFGSIWMTDHFFWDDLPTFEAWTAISYLAAKWPDFKIGPVVLGQSYRNPAITAKMAATLQTLCNGNLIMGIGAGWKEDEYHAYGYPFPRAGIRVAQLEDTLEIMTRMWREEGPITYTGKHYSIKDAYCEPKPDPIPPILVGGGGNKTMMLAARFADMWNIPDANIVAYSERLDILKQHCESIQRDPETLQLSWFGRLGVNKTEDSAIRLSDGKWTSDNAIVGTPSQVIDTINQFNSLGVDHFIIEILGIEDPEIMNLLFENVLPFFQ